MVVAVQQQEGPECHRAVNVKMVKVVELMLK